MLPFETLASVATPDGATLALHRRGDDHFIYLDGEELMSSRAYGSEEALAELACADLPSQSPRVLIGGLGLGYTLRASLAILPKSSEVVVAEFFPAVVEWNRKFLTGGASTLDDRRVTVREGDVAELIATTEKASFDAIMLDVDNGPSAWCRPSNATLYDSNGLARIQRALSQSGVLAVWSAYEDQQFLRQLKRSGFEAKRHIRRSRGDKGARQTVFVGRKR